MKTNKVLFLAVTVLLVVVIIGTSAMILAKGPRTSLVELVSQEGSSAVVDDLYEGHMTIPYWDIPTSPYEVNDFAEEENVVSYLGGNSTLGVSLYEKCGEVDWEQLKTSGIDFVMIRAGYRSKYQGTIFLDKEFENNLAGAEAAGIPVGIYFYSKAISDVEAEEEAEYVLDLVRGHSIKYPIAFYWEYDLKDDGSQDESARVTRCNGEQATGFIDTFCGIIRKAGFTPAFYATKSHAYNRLNLSRLSNYDMWYSEYQAKPSFYYDFKMWQYTDSGSVPGIYPDQEKGGKVRITLCMKKYG